MIPNSSQTYERENTVATVNEKRQGDALKNGLFIVKTKTIPIDDQLKI